MSGARRSVRRRRAATSMSSERHVDAMTAAFPTLEPADVPTIARLCETGMVGAPTEDDLRRVAVHAGLAGHGPRRPGTGSWRRASVTAARRCGSSSSIPSARGRGLGRALLDAAEADLADATTITVGADAPDYLFPGVDTAETAMLCLLERRRYVRGEANLNLVVDLARLPPRSRARRSRGTTTPTRSTPGWRPTGRCGGSRRSAASHAGRLMIARDDEGIVAFCCWDGARTGWVGPVAVRPSAIGQGRGRGVLLGALHRLRAAGRHDAEIGWVGPIVPYAVTVGARIHRVFLVYRKQRTASVGLHPPRERRPPDDPRRRARRPGHVRSRHRVGDHAPRRLQGRGVRPAATRRGDRGRRRRRRRRRAPRDAGACATRPTTSSPSDPETSVTGRGRDLEPRGRALGFAEVAEAVDAICPAIEIVDDRRADYRNLEVLSVIADNSWNAGIVLGDFVRSWPELKSIEGIVAMDGTITDRGFGRDVLGHPFHPVAWLATHLARIGTPLRAGDIVMTGNLVTTKFPEPPCAYRFDLIGLGSVEVSINV